MDVVMMSNLRLNINYPLGDFQQNGTCTMCSARSKFKPQKNIRFLFSCLLTLITVFFLLSSPIMINQSTFPQVTGYSKEEFFKSALMGSFVFYDITSRVCVQFAWQPHNCSSVKVTLHRFCQSTIESKLSISFTSEFLYLLSMLTFEDDGEHASLSLMHE